MILRVTKSILWTSSLVYNWKKQSQTLRAARYINKEIKTKTKHGNTITVLASLSDTIKTEMHFSDEPRQPGFRSAQKLKKKKKKNELPKSKHVHSYATMRGYDKRLDNSGLDLHSQ